MPAPYSYLDGLQPVDISPQVQSIAQNLAGGLTASLQASAAQEQARRQAQFQAQQRAMLVEDMRDYAAAPSVQKFGALLGKYPSMQKQLEEVQKRIGAEEQKGALSFISPTLSLLQNGQTSLAVDMIRQRNEAMANSNQPNKAEVIANGEAMIKAIESGPEGANAAIGALIRDYAIASGTADPAKLIETQATLPSAAAGAAAETRAEEQEAVIKQQQAALETRRLLGEIFKTQTMANESAARTIDIAKRYDLDVAKLTEETGLKLLELQAKNEELPDLWMKKADEINTNAVASQQMAQRAFDLAAKFEAMGSSWGLGASAASGLRSVFGSQDAVDLLRKEYVAYKNKGVGEALKSVGGNDSDRDVKLWSEGYPGEFADPKFTAQFLRGQGKAAAFDALLGEAQMQWISQNGRRGTTPAGTNMEVLGFVVPRGMTYADFQKRHGPEIFARAVLEYEKSTALRDERWGAAAQGVPAIPQSAGPEQSIEPDSFTWP